MSDAPQTLEGWYALHDIRRLDWTAWKRLAQAERQAVLSEATAFLQRCEEVDDADEGSSAFYSVPGHKGDVMFLHLRPTLDDLLQLEIEFSQTRLADFTKQSYSYVSVTELSQYLSGDPGERTPQQETFVARRLKPAIPRARYASFYPMNKKRGESDNWYTLTSSERKRLMQGHGVIGRSYRDQVQQMITGSMGFDDWEWGVTLYAADPLPLKKIVHEMRFDEASSKYALFGPFFLGVQLAPGDLESFLAGKLPR